MKICKVEILQLRITQSFLLIMRSCFSLSFQNNFSFRLFIAYNQRPSVTQYLRNHTYPTREQGLARKAKLPDPFTYVLPNGDLNRTGEYYIGLKALNTLDIYAKFGYTPSMNYTLRIFETRCKVWDEDLKIWTSKGCKVSDLFCLAMNYDCSLSISRLATFSTF